MLSMHPTFSILGAWYKCSVTANYLSTSVRSWDTIMLCTATPKDLKLLWNSCGWVTSKLIWYPGQLQYILSNLYKYQVCWQSIKEQLCSPVFMQYLYSDVLYLSTPRCPGFYQYDLVLIFSYRQTNQNALWLSHRSRADMYPSMETGTLACKGCLRMH